MIAAVALLFAHAQEPQPPAPQRFTKTVLTLSTDDSFRFEADLDDSDAKVSIAHYKISGELFHMEGMENIIRVSAAGEFLEYDFEDLDTLVPGAPRETAEEVHAYRVDPSFVHVFDPTWSGFVYGTVSVAYEEHASLGDALSGAAGVGALYRSSPELKLGLAIHVQFRIEDKPWLYPLPYVEWRLSPRAILKTEQKAGYGLTFDYTLDEANTVLFESRMRYQGRRVRLREESVPSEGIFDDQRFMVDVGVRFEPRKDLKLGLYVGVELWQQYTFEDSRGHRGIEDETEPQAFVGFAGSWAF